MRKNILIGVVIAVALTVAGYIASYRWAPSAADGAHLQAVATTSARAVPAGYNEYTSATYHFSLLYPDDLSVEEYKEQGTAMTLVFANADQTKSFQIFVVPYGEQEITPERLKLDLPSGVINDQTNIVVGGKPATIFFSTDAALGDTREVWFINHGFLFEVTTYKSLDSWLSQVMQGWEFF